MQNIIPVLNSVTSLSIHKKKHRIIAFHSQVGFLSECHAHCEQEDPQGKRHR